MDGTLLGKKYDLMDGGGSGGTSDYEELSNLPKINSVELKGNKSLNDLGIQSKLTFDNVPTENSDNPVKSGGVFSALPGIATAAVAGLVKPDGTSISVDANGVISAAGTIIKPIYTSNIAHTDQGITVNFSHTFTEAGFLFVNVVGRFMEGLTLEFNNNQLFLMETDYYHVANRILPVAVNDTFEIAASTSGSDDSLVADVYLIKGYTPVSGNTRKKKS